MSSAPEQISPPDGCPQVPGGWNTAELPKVIVDEVEDTDSQRSSIVRVRRSSLNPISWLPGRRSPAPDSSHAAIRKGSERDQDLPGQSQLGDLVQGAYGDGNVYHSREPSSKTGFSFSRLLGLGKSVPEKRTPAGTEKPTEPPRGNPSQGARQSSFHLEHRTRFTDATNLDVDDIGQEGYLRPMTWGELVTQLAPLAPFISIIECLQLIFDAADAIKTNKAHWRGLRNQCVFTSLVVAFQYQQYKDDPDNEKFITQVCGEVAETIRDVEKSALKWCGKYPIVAFAQFERMSDDIQLHIQRLEASRKALETAARVLSEARLKEMAEKQKEEQKEIRALYESIKQLQHTDVLEQLKRTDSNDPELSAAAKAALQREMSRLNQSEGDYEKIGKAIDFIVSLTGVQVPMEVFHKKVCTNVSSEPISRTPTCTVYTATFVGEQLVAKKLLEIGKYSEGDVKTYAEKVCRDVREWQKFDSKYTLPCLGIGMERFGDGAFKMYMISPYIKNKDAMTYLKPLRGLKEGRVTQEIDKKDVLRIVQGAALGLVEVHRRGSVHSNMRGDNVLVGSDGMGILGGFGLTKSLQTHETGKLAAIEQTGMNPPYRWMAPECVNPSKGKPEVTQANDVWGWAMTTLQIVTGILPIRTITNDMWLFSGTQSHFYIQRREYPEFELFAHQPDELWSLLEQCWSREQQNRPTMQKVVEQLDRIIMMP